MIECNIYEGIFSVYNWCEGTNFFVDDYGQAQTCMHTHDIYINYGEIDIVCVTFDVCLTLEYH